jgi:hypothetical protein
MWQSCQHISFGTRLRPPVQVLHVAITLADGVEHLGASFHRALECLRCLFLANVIEDGSRGDEAHLPVATDLYAETVVEGAAMHMILTGIEERGDIVVAVALDQGQHLLLVFLARLGQDPLE